MPFVGSDLSSFRDSEVPLVSFEVLARGFRSVLMFSFLFRAFPLSSVGLSGVVSTWTFRGGDVVRAFRYESKLS